MQKPLQQLAAIALIALAAACASTNDPTRPQINIEELQVPTYAAEGPFDVQYQLQITNPSSRPITLRRVELATTGGPAAYSLERRPYVFNQTIGPGITGAVNFWAHAYANYYPGDPNSTQTVSIRGIAIFDTPSGSIRQVFTKVLSQFQ